MSVAALEATTPALDPAAVFTIPLAERERLVRSGRLDPAAFRRDLVEHVREADPAVRAFADWRPSDIAGSRLPLVASVTYKDTIDVAGYATRLGITSGYRRFPRASADIASRLERAGLACVGKVATTECALGSVLPSRNPRFPHVSAGGSSSGSAAAVAAGFCDVSVGTDSGGSLRWPAIYCGATALRLTPRPALLRGVHAVAPSMESVGFVTRSAADLAWLWRRYRLAERLALAPAPRRSSSLRLCFSTPAGEPLHAEVDALLRAVGDALDDHGHAVVGAPLHDIWERRADAWELLAREAYDSYGPLLRDPDIPLQAGTQAAIEAGAGVDDARLAALRREQATAGARLAALLREECDVLVLPLEAGLADRAHRVPATTIPAPAEPARDLTMTIVASFARLPALALPLALSSEGSPLGLQLLGAPGSEALLIDAGVRLAALAAGRPWSRGFVSTRSPEEE